MNKIMDGITVVALFAASTWLCVVIYIIVLDDKPKKSEIYAECLETDYDKFQCYSMIYGDK